MRGHVRVRLLCRERRIMIATPAAPVHSRRDCRGWRWPRTSTRHTIDDVAGCPVGLLPARSAPAPQNIKQRDPIMKRLDLNALACGIVMALLLAGCGDDGAGTDDGAAAPPPPPPTSAVAPDAAPADGTTDADSPGTDAPTPKTIPESDKSASAVKPGTEDKKKQIPETGKKPAAKTDGKKPADGKGAGKDTPKGDSPEAATVDSQMKDLLSLANKGEFDKSLAQIEVVLARKDLATIEKQKHRAIVFFAAQIAQAHARKLATDKDVPGAHAAFITSAKHFRHLQKDFKPLFPQESGFGGTVFYNEACALAAKDQKAAQASLTEAVDRLTAQDDVFFSKRFILPRPLLQAIQSDSRSVLLIDEIDKADAEFEAFLLEILSDFQITIPELGTIEAIHIPVVVLTSNNAREMSDALKRRCLHLYIDFPSPELELEIVKLKVPEAAEAITAELVEMVHSIRALDLKKAPSISETLDWAKALVIMNVDSLEDDLVADTLSVICKYEGDLRKAEKELAAYVQKKRAAREAEQAPATPEEPVSDKDLLN